MAAKSGLLENMMREKIAAQPEPAPARPKARAQAPARPAAVVPLPVPAEAASKAPIEKVTLYLPRPAYKFIKQVALDLDRKPHDLLIEGVEAVLRQHGKSLKDFQG